MSERQGAERRRSDRMTEWINSTLPSPDWLCGRTGMYKHSQWHQSHGEREEEWYVLLQKEKFHFWGIWKVSTDIICVRMRLKGYDYFIKFILTRYICTQWIKVLLDSSLVCVRWSEYHFLVYSVDRFTCGDETRWRFIFPIYCSCYEITLHI